MGWLGVLLGGMGRDGMVRDVMGRMNGVGWRVGYVGLAIKVPNCTSFRVIVGASSRSIKHRSQIIRV